VALAEVEGDSIAFGVDGTGSSSFYGPAVTGLGVGNIWRSYNAELFATQPYTITLSDVQVTLNDTDVYSGTLAVVVDGLATGAGMDSTAAPNFAEAAYIQTQEAGIIIGPATGTALVGGEPIDVSNGLALAHYTGPITITEATTTTDRVELEGNADFFTLHLSPDTSTTDPNTPVTFQALIDANFTDTYTLTVEGPRGWDVQLDSSGVITATPPRGATPADYSILVTAQSGAYPDLFLSAVHTVATTPFQGMDLAVVEDPLITVPIRPARPGTLPGDTNSGQIQLPDTAYTVDITNTSTIPHTFDVTVTGLPDDWLILSGAEGNQTAVTLPAGGRDTASADLLVVAAPEFAVAVTPKQATVANSTAVTYTITITNQETAEQSYSLAVHGLAGSEMLLPGTVSVAAGGAITVSLPITAYLPHGPHAFTVVAAVANTNAGRSDDAVLLVVGDRRVQVELSPAAAVGGPAVPVPYTLTVTNAGSLPDSYAVAVELPSGWSYRLDANGAEVDSLNLTPHVFNAADLLLIVTPPAGAPPGVYSFAAVAQSTSNPHVRARVTAELEVTQYGVQVTLSPDQTTMSPLDTGIWQVTVTNTGLQADTYELTAGGIVAASAQFSQDTVSLAPGQSQVVQLTAAEMDFALPQTYPLMVQARSLFDGRIRNQATAAVTFTGFENVVVSWLPPGQLVTNTLQATFMLLITNTGNISTLYDLAALGDELDLTLEVGQVYIPPYMTAGILVTARAAAPGVYTFQGVATSSSSGATAGAAASLVIDLIDQPPTVDAGPDITAAEGETVQFAGSIAHPDGVDYTVIWDFGDGATAMATLNPAHTYADDGVYVVTLTATDANGLSASDTLLVTVNNVAPTVHAGPDQTVNVGETVFFTGSFTDPGVMDSHSVLWQFGDGITAATSLTLTHVYTNAGVYTVTLTVTDNGNDSGSDTVTVTVLPVNQAPVAVADAATTFKDTAVTIHVLANDYDPDGDKLTVAAAGEPANGTAVVNADNTITYTPAPGFLGVDSFVYTIADGHGAPATAAVTITVTPQPVSSCGLYPIALHAQTLDGAVPGDTILNIFNGQQPGNFGWLTWTGDLSIPVLVNSLTAPGDSHTYINPNDPNDGVISVGDWVYGRPGVGNTDNIRAALDALKTIDITVPIWDVTAGNGSNTQYRVAGLAQVRLISYDLPGENRITVQFLGYITCGETVETFTTLAHTLYLERRVKVL
jgi:uncharacterized membrane protein